MYVLSAWKKHNDEDRTRQKKHWYKQSSSQNLSCGLLCFMSVCFLLSSFCSALSIKKNINKKGDASQWSTSFWFCCMSFPLKNRDFISKNTFTCLCKVARQGASYRLLSEFLASVEAVAVLLLIAHFYIPPMPKHIVW